MGSRERWDHLDQKDIKEPKVTSVLKGVRGLEAKEEKWAQSDLLEKRDHLASWADGDLREKMGQPE